MCFVLAVVAKGCSACYRHMHRRRSKTRFQEPLLPAYYVYRTHSPQARHFSLMTGTAVQAEDVPGHRDHNSHLSATSKEVLRGTDSTSTGSVRKVWNRWRNILFSPVGPRRVENNGEGFERRRWNPFAVMEKCDPVTEGVPQIAMSGNNSSILEVAVSGAGDGRCVGTIATHPQPGACLLYTSPSPRD
mgnify:CR=1 FL=1